MKLFKRIAISMCCLLLMVGLTGCFLNYGYYVIVGVTQMCYAIPGGYVDDQHVSWDRLIEKDDYGRMLFKVKAANMYDINGMLITQKVDENYVYYYDSISYLCEKGDVNEFSDEQIAQLKELNDWNKPLDESKMIKRELHGKTNLFPAMNYGNLKWDGLANAIFKDKVGVPEGCQCEILICDRSTTGQELYLISIYELDRSTKHPTAIWRKHYLMLINADSSHDPDNYLVSFDNLYESNEPLKQVKEQNGWVG